MQIEALIERLEGLQGPDREVDDAIFWHFSEWENIGGWWRRHKTTGKEERYSYTSPPAYSASLDAAIALVEKVLPGWSGDIDICRPIADSGKLGARLFPPGDGWQNYAGEGSSSAIALLLAMFRALAAGGSDAQGLKE
jgi:hypothetical protein